MKTQILPPNINNIKYAADLLLNGNLVAIPTETVYGLAANIFDDSALNNIFKVKNRPQDNPLIVHISSIKMLEQITNNISDTALRLMEAFWHGPLSIIFPKSEKISKIVTAGLDSVAVRMPSNPTALAIIEQSGVPLAAPSANSSGYPSPTSAEHVYNDLQGKIPLIIDGGNCEIGIESTVVKIENDNVIILRPGGITVEMIQNLNINVILDKSVTSKTSNVSQPVSPGTKYKHYSPKATVIAIKGSIEDFADYVNKQKGNGIYAVVFEGEETYIKNFQTIDLIGNCAVQGRRPPLYEDTARKDNDAMCSFRRGLLFFGKQTEPLTQANLLYNILREIDDKKGEKIFIRCPKPERIGLAVYNRIIRAAESVIDFA